MPPPGAATAVGGDTGAGRGKPRRYSGVGGAFRISSYGLRSGMFGLVVTLALLLWFVSRGRLWKRIFNLRRELRSAVRKGSFSRYYISIRLRELAGLFGFALLLVPGSPAEFFEVDASARWLRPGLYVVIALYGLYIVWDVWRLRRRFARLIAAGPAGARR
jgi:hypothetical protein